MATQAIEKPVDKEVERPQFTSPEAEAFALAQRQANALAASDLIPQRFQGKVGNCLVALNMAKRLGADPLMVMQNLYIVHGNPGWSAQFLIASFNQSGKFSSIKYRLDGEGDEYGCTAYATELSTGDVIEGPKVTWALVKGEQWLQKNGSKWKTMPEIMFRYRSAAFLIRTTAPEIAMGLKTTEELEDIGPDVQPRQFSSGTSSTSEMKELAASKPEVIIEEQRKALVDAAKGNTQRLSEIVKESGFELIADITVEAYNAILEKVSAVDVPAPPEPEAKPEPPKSAKSMADKRLEWLEKVKTLLADVDAETAEKILEDYPPLEKDASTSQLKDIFLALEKALTSGD